MVCKLLNIFKNVGASAILLLLTATPGISSTEYVFTAPPEVNRQIVEAPPRDTHYPLYECSADTTKEADALEAHDCHCPDCGTQAEKSELEVSETISGTEVEQP